MKTLDPATRQFILNLMGSAPDLTLATLRPDGYPQATTISYVNDGLTLYAGIGLDSQKAHNIRQNNKVSLTITPPYSDWNQITGLSMAATAAIVGDAAQAQHASDLMLLRFPQLRQLMSGTGQLPWAGAVFLCITPCVISVLNYQLGFGHAELYQVAG